MPLKNEINRWLGRDTPVEHEPKKTPGSVAVEPSSVSADWHMQLDEEGRVTGISKPLRGALGLAAAVTPAQRLLGYLMPSSALVVEGAPQDWHGHMLDLDFRRPNGQVLHTRGWVQAQGENWLLQLLDIGDLMEEANVAQSRQQCLRLAGQLAEKVRGCHVERLQAVTAEQLEDLAHCYHVPCLALALAEPGGTGWRIFAHYNAHTAPQLWQDGQRLGTDLDSLSGMQTHQVDFGEPTQRVRLQSAFGNAEGFLLPHHKEGSVKAWLLFGFYNAVQQTPELSEREWMNLCSALAGPILYRHADQAHRHQLERLAVLQDLLGTGWWEFLPDSDEVQLAPQLVH